MTRYEEAQIAKLAAETEPPDLSGYDLSELHQRVVERVSRRVSDAVDIGMCVAECVRRQSMRELEASTDSIVPRSTASRWSRVFRRANP